jgi:lipid-binding SYLF domain-containing protein
LVTPNKEISLNSMRTSHPANPWPHFKEALFLIVGLIAFFPNMGFAKTADEIDNNVDIILEKFSSRVPGAKEFLQSAEGILVFPNIIKGGIFFGGKYGEGALRIAGATTNYYNVTGLSFGLQLGAQARTLIILFMQKKALNDFRESQGWEVGIDGSIAVLELGFGGSVDTTNMRTPILAFMLNNRGLMFNVTMEGSKFTKIVR